MNNNILIQDFINFLKNIIGDIDYFSCIYGSQVHGTSGVESDIDVLFFVENPESQDVEKIKKGIVGFHANNGLTIDNEVPFENKLLISYKDLQEAINLQAFDLVENNFFIPKVEKTNVFLNSTAIKKRLALYTLTAPHIVFGNCLEKYQMYKENAEMNIVLLAIDLINKDTFDTCLILEILLVGKNGEQGELYLGYKRYPLVLEYLQSFIERQLKKMFLSGYIKIDNGKVKIISNNLLDNLKIKIEYENI